MADNGALSQRQKRFIACLIEARNVREGAAHAGIGERTAFRYLQNGAVRAELRLRQGAVLGAVTMGLVSSMSEAVDVLVGMMNDDKIAAGVRARAALGVLDAGLRVFETLSLADRLSVLEDRISQAGGRE